MALAPQGGQDGPHQPGSGLLSTPTRRPPSVAAGTHAPSTSLTAPGGLLQDYFADLCVCLTKNDVQTLLTRERGLCPQPPPGHQGRGLSPLTPDSVPLAWGTPLFSLRLGSTTGL